MEILRQAGGNDEKMKEKREKFPALLEKNKTIWYDNPVPLQNVHILSR